jgi:hypothetical protein
VESDRGGLETSAIEDAKELRHGCLSTVHVEADESILGRRLADERKVGDECQHPVPAAVDPEGHHVAGDLSLQLI